MKLPLQITYRNVDQSEAIEEAIRQRAAKLERFFGRIIGCRVVVEAPHQRQHKGNHYRVLVDVSIPGYELVAGRDPADHGAHEDLYTAIRDAFNAVQRELQEVVDRRREQERRA
jgi:ribosomal subunit interface protein